MKVKNTTVWERSAVWMGEIQVENKKCGERIGEVMVGNVAS